MVKECYEVVVPSYLELIRWCFTSHSDKSAGGRFLEEFEETSLRLQDFCTCLGVEVSERANVATMLKECKAYHATKLTELQALAQVCTCGHLNVLEPPRGLTGNATDLQISPVLISLA